MNILRFYTGNRRYYPYLFGAAIWVAWLISIFGGPTNFDLAGQVVGTDYLMFYTAGSTLLDGNQAEIYDFENQFQRQVEIIGPDHSDYFAYINLPFLAWLYVPLASAPYLISFALWSLIGLGFFWTALWLLDKPNLFWIGLTFFPVIANITFGQNAFVSFLILSAVYALWSNEKKLLAGILLGFLLYKPQLVMGIGFLWLLNIKEDWKSLVGFAIGAGSVAGIMFGLMPDATDAYLIFAQETLPRLAELENFPIWLMNHPRGFWQLLLPEILSEPLWIIGNLIGLFVFWRLWQARQSTDKRFWYALAILLTLWTTPHAMIYDWTLLFIPAVLLWQSRPEWHNQLLPIFMWGWLVYILSTPLVAGQLAIMPIAIQISVLFFAWALFKLYALITENG